MMAQEAAMTAIAYPMVETKALHHNEAPGRGSDLQLRSTGSRRATSGDLLTSLVTDEA